MVNTLNYDLDIDSTLGGDNASDYVIPSQKAIKSYVDNNTGSTVDQVYDPTSQAAQSGIAIAGANFLTSSDLTNYVTTDTDQNITGVKTFVGDKRVKFKGANSNSKLGFTAFDSSNREVGYLECQGQGNASHKCRLGVYDTNTSTYDNVLGFEYYKGKGSDGSIHRYNLLCPPLYPSTTAQDFYIPMAITDGTNTVNADNTGVVDISSLLPSLANYVTNSSLATTLADYALTADIPTKTSELTNDSNFATVSQIPTNNNQLTNGAGYITSSALSPYALSSSLSTVATSGSYTDLSDKPTIPTVPTNISAFTNDSGYITSADLNGYATETWVSNQGYALSSSLSTVATSGSYADLSNKPTIPTVDQTYDGTSANAQSGVAIEGELSTNYQNKLVSGTNIKTVNNTSILGSGNIDTSEIVVILQSEAEHLHYTYQDIYDLVWGSKPVYYYKESNNLFFPFIGFDSNNSIIFGLPDIYIATTGHNGFKYVYIDTNGAWHTGFDDIEVEISDKVNKSGDTMTGGLIIQRDDNSLFLRCQRTDAIKGTTPSSSKYWGLHFIDGQGSDVANRMGSVEARYTDTGTTRVDLTCYEPTSGSTTLERISIGCSPTDGFYTYAPTPPVGSNNSNIATTAFVHRACDGQWIDSRQYILDDDSITHSSGKALYKTVTLPNDGYKYEVVFRGAVTTGSTSGNYIMLTITGNESSYGSYICGCQTRTNSTMFARGECSTIMSYGSSNLTIARNSAFNGTASLDVIRYRRIGKNS